MRVALATMMILCGTAVGQAQEAVATTVVNVRSGHSMSSRILDHLTEGDTVSLLSATKRNGYYHVEEADGTHGWVYSRYLALVVESGATPPAASAATVVGRAAPRVDPAWGVGKPEARVAVFHRAGFPDCAAVGSAGDTITDRLKNRVDEPATYHPVTFDAMLALPYPTNHKPHRTSWPQTDVDVIAPYEGIAVSVTGFIAKKRGIIVESAPYSKNGESTNCHATDPDGVDWHMTLVKNPGDDKSAGIVVETTPRVRANGHPWSPDMFTSAIAAEDSVRISGWLLYDPEHFAQTTNYDPARPSHGAPVRATLWEVHPVTRIDVFDARSGRWKTLP